MFSAIRRGLRDVRIQEGTSIADITAVPAFYYQTELERLYFQSPDTAANIQIGTGGGFDIGNTFKNTIINGNMLVNQRNGSPWTFSASGGSYTLDRWHVQYSSDVGTFQIKQTVDSPLDDIEHCLELDCTGADGTISTGEYGYIRQIVEGINLRKLWNKEVTLSFWVKSNKNGSTLCTGIHNGNSTRAYVTEHTINAADTWEKKTVTIQMDMDTGTWVDDNSAALVINFPFIAGSSYQTSTTDQWFTTGGYPLGTSNQGNFLSNTSDYLKITGVQLEIGPTDSDFEVLSPLVQLWQCDRYYQAYKFTATQDFEPEYDDYPLGRAVSTNSSYHPMRFRTAMRASPSVFFSAASNFQYNKTGGCNSISTTGNIKRHSCMIVIGVSGTPFTTGQAVTLGAQTTAQHMWLTAEL